MLDLVDISVAIPDSCLLDEQTLRDKTLKLGQIARASAIFRVKTIYLYQDKDPQAKKADRRLIKLMLRYLDTPQYLRKILYPQMQELRYAGILPPIRAAHHKDWRRIEAVKQGEIRVGVAVRVRDRLFVDIGLGPLVRLDGKAPVGAKLCVKLKSTFPKLRAEAIDEEKITSSYWGFRVHETKSLMSLLNQITNSVVILASRRGKSLKNINSELLYELKSKRRILLVFGSPRRGVSEILANEGYNPGSCHFIVNMFPCQGTKTVRLEEAFLGTLAVINYFLDL